MAALKKGDQGEADRLMGRNENHQSLLPGMAKLKGMVLGRKKKDNDEKEEVEEEDGKK